MLSCNEQSTSEKQVDVPALTLKSVAEATPQSTVNSNDAARTKRLALEKKYNIDSGALINISDIAGKSLAGVEKKLGKPDNVEKARPSGTPCTNGECKKAFFQGGHYEVLFINGKADWITINNVSGFDLNSGSIKLLGLPSVQPAFTSSSVVRWTNIKGIKEISFFNNGSDKIDYIYIKVKTK
ncbi:hypothetical protein GCM10022409_11070 [Hymenobacter glaciei]|uniref:Lipoprotein n=1 Tax=Hymenobacter glaciei TaxID=877209 RepID=A0ABP7TN76_9BACT